MLPGGKSTKTDREEGTDLPGNPHFPAGGNVTLTYHSGANAPKAAANARDLGLSTE